MSGHVVGLAASLVPHRNLPYRVAVKRMAIQRGRGVLRVLGTGKRRTPQGPWAQFWRGTKIVFGSPGMWL